MNPLLLFAEFFKIGLFSVGGGLATLPFLFELAGKYPWLTHEEIGNILAVAQSSPGAIGVNMSAETGFESLGAGGALIAAAGLVTPSIIIIIIVARFLQAFKENDIVTRVFSGLRPAAAGLLAAAGLGAWKIALYDPEWKRWYEILRWRECALFAVIFLLLRTFKLHPVVYIAAAGAVGVILKLS